MKYPPQVIDQIKARLNIVDEVRKVVPNMKKKGRAWWGCCPFHNEKSGSFHVREDQNSYYCFGCGAGGDVITFVQETQGGTFSEVVGRLARQIGIKLPENEPADPAAAQRRQDGYKALERAAVFYQRSLNEASRAYIEKRSLTESTVQEFQLGYAPDSWDATKNALLNEGFSPELLKSTGLTTQSEKTAEKGRDYDRFRDRLMFPIHDNQGRVVGFGGRVMGKGEPKYLNSPETPFFNKSYLLYNLHRAKPHIKTTGQIVLVEGYMDVIALYQAGFKTAVAPLGTAVTAEQITLLWQQHPHPIVCLDGDAAGRTAALRMANRALGVLEPGRTLSFVFLPQGEDPDSLVQKDGIATFRNLLTQTTSLENLLWQQLAGAADVTTADGRATVEAEMAQLLAEIKNTTIRRAYGQTLKDKLWEAVRGTRAGPRAGKPQTQNVMQAPRDYKPAIQGDAATRTLLALVCRWPQILPQVDEILGGIAFPPGPLAELSQAVVRAYVVLKLPAEDLAQDLQLGPHSATVADLLTSTGVLTLPDETDALVLFHEQHQLWQTQTVSRSKYTEIVKNADWFSPESWNKFKKLKET
ncbi:MAG: DNA primase [Blastochloris viridis]|uniref:DNA primase n=1 Tax=Blastochloris viridis TaxID=1079 RepID=A0A6N4R554_BLAVI|nr:MAG: DNA primase [Blastochloris viridis]